jgi:hypothetical protein
LLKQETFQMRATLKVLMTLREEAHSYRAVKLRQENRACRIPRSTKLSIMGTMVDLMPTAEEAILVVSGDGFLAEAVSTIKTVDVSRTGIVDLAVEVERMKKPRPRTSGIEADAVKVGAGEVVVTLVREDALFSKTTKVEADSGPMTRSKAQIPNLLLGVGEVAEGFTAAGTSTQAEIFEEAAGVEEAEAEEWAVARVVEKWRLESQTKL